MDSTLPYSQTSVADGVHPAKIDMRRLKPVALHHLAWSEALSRAVTEKEHRGGCGLWPGGRCNHDPPVCVSALLSPERKPRPI